jgi:hypothetical protein
MQANWERTASTVSERAVASDEDVAQSSPAGFVMDRWWD